MNEEIKIFGIFKDIKRMHTKGKNVNRIEEIFSIAVRLYACTRKLYIHTGI